MEILVVVIVGIVVLGIIIGMVKRSGKKPKRGDFDEGYSDSGDEGGDGGDDDGGDGNDD